MPAITMDSTSYELWQKLRAPCVQRLKPKALYGTACSLAWLAAGLLFGQTGLLSLALVWFVLFLPVGFAHMLFAGCKEDWESWFAPSFYLLSPLIAAGIIAKQFVGLLKGMPLIPTILSGRNLASISYDGDVGYCFKMTSGQTVAITRDKYDRRRLFVGFHQGGCSGVVGSELSQMLLYLDDGLLGAPTAIQPKA